MKKQYLHKDYHVNEKIEFIKILGECIVIIIICVGIAFFLFSLDESSREIEAQKIDRMEAI
jgi:hypothetical protein